MGAEALALFAVRRWLRRGPGLRPLAPTLASGACLVLGLRAALTGAPAVELAAWLALALLAHAVDLARRWRD
jgi:hypothetical protein